MLALIYQLFRYHEKPLQQKLEILYQRNLYVLAISLAQKAGIDAAQHNVILRKYGDYLYSKGDFDTAMQQYLKAIDNTEPSQVIRKVWIILYSDDTRLTETGQFLDTQRIHNLIEYLEELHEHDKATVDHTTLLLNCYAKLKDTAKLETFIKSGNNFDLDTAISMCRQGGYYEQAVYLAKKHGEHELVVDILIEDSKNYGEALDYIWRLEPDLAYPNLMKYARVLLEHCPKDATQVFIDYYTGQYRPKKDTVLPSAPVPQGAAAIAVQNLTSFIPLPYRQISAAATPTTASNQQLSDAPAAEAEDASSPREYNIPKPRTAFSSFIDHSMEFVTFLEACLKQAYIEEGNKVDLHTTLFEMYLETASEKKSPEKEEWENKAKRLIQGQNVSLHQELDT